MADTLAICRRLTFAAGFLVLMLFTACNGPNAPLIIATDIPEVVEYLELVRADLFDPSYEVIYTPETDRMTAIGEISPDIIISTSIASEAFQEYIYPIPRKLLEGSQRAQQDGFSLTDLYSDSLRAVSDESTIRLLPLAFDLPIIYFSDDLAPVIPEGTEITYEHLLNIAAEYTVLRGSNYSNMGFSSMRDPGFLDMLIRDHSGEGETIPSAEDLDEAMQWLSEYLNENSQQLEAQIYFNSIFAYSTDNADITADRLESVYSSYLAHHTMDPPALAAYPFRWLSGERGVQASSVVYIGVLDKSSRKRRAVRFSRTLLSGTTQKLYLLDKNSPKSGNVGFLNRVSTNSVFNRTLLPQVFGEYFLDIPETIVFPGIPDAQWPQIQSEVYYPWLLDRLTDSSHTPSELAGLIDSFYRLNGVYR